MMVRADGFTLWELMIVIALVVALFVTALENLLPLRGDAEEAALLATVGSLKSATGLEASRRAVTNISTLRDMDRMNPMAWLAVEPKTYIGDVGDLHEVPRGGWGFLPDEGVLFYRVRYPEYFHGGLAEPAGVRFRVDVDQVDGRVTDIRLVQLDQGEWRTDGAEIARLLGHDNEQ